MCASLPTPVKYLGYELTKSGFPTLKEVLPLPQKPLSVDTLMSGGTKASHWHPLPAVMAAFSVWNTIWFSPSFPWPTSILPLSPKPDNDDDGNDNMNKNLSSPKNSTRYTKGFSRDDRSQIQGFWSHYHFHLSLGPCNTLQSIRPPR